MIYLKKFNEGKENESIEAICQKYGIENYTINEDGTIDVNGNVILSNRRLTKLPLKFRNVSSNFDCSYNKLKTLEGAPITVGDNFNCDHNQLTSLKGAPQSVRGYFNCSYNQLTTLEGAPRTLGYFFDCSVNQLVNLEFAPSCKVLICHSNLIYKWWSKVVDTSKLDAFIDLGIDSRDPNFMNREKINLLKE